MSTTYLDPMTKRKRERLIEMLKNLKKTGLKTYICKEPTSAYGLITDGNDFISLSGATYGTGITVSFLYRPSQKNGTGCMLEDSLLGITKDVNIEDFKNWVKEGRNLARRYGAVLYSDITGPYIGENDQPLDKFKRISKYFDLYEEF